MKKLNFPEKRGYLKYTERRGDDFEVRVSNEGKIRHRYGDRITGAYRCMDSSEGDSRLPQDVISCHYVLGLP